MTALLFSPFYPPPALAHVFLLSGVPSNSRICRTIDVGPIPQKVKLESVTFPLPQQFHGDRIAGVALKEPFEYRDRLLLVAEVVMDLGQRHVSGLVGR